MKMSALDAENQACHDPNSEASARNILALSTQTPLTSDALCSFAAQDYSNLVRCGLLAGISACARDADGCPALCFAARGGGVVTVLLLIEGGADVNATDPRTGSTALHEAVRNNQAAALRALVAASANANVADSGGNTPLLEAVSRAQLDCVRALLPVSDLSARSDGRTALHLAVAAGDVDVFELLLPRFLQDVDARTRRSEGVTSDQTALHLACIAGREDLVRALVQQGASWEVKDSAQCSPLYYCTIYAHVKCLAHWLLPPTHQTAKWLVEKLL
jgi:ankyrin repeat protein